MKIYWTGANKDNYHIFDGQYYPYSGKYCNNEFTTFEFGSFAVNFSSPAHYLVRVDHYYGWILWKHELTFGANSMGKVFLLLKDVLLGLLFLFQRIKAQH